MQLKNSFPIGKDFSLFSRDFRYSSSNDVSGFSVNEDGNHHAFMLPPYIHDLVNMVNLMVQDIIRISNLISFYSHLSKAHQVLSI